MHRSGYSPLTVMGLDPGKVYTVNIRVFDGNQMVLNNEGITKTIRVISTTSSKIVHFHGYAFKLAILLYRFKRIKYHKRYRYDYFARVYSNKTIVNIYYT